MTQIAEFLQHLLKKLGLLIGAKCKMTNFAKNRTIPQQKN